MTRRHLVMVGVLGLAACEAKDDPVDTDGGLTGTGTGAVTGTGAATGTGATAGTGTGAVTGSGTGATGTGTGTAVGYDLTIRGSGYAPLAGQTMWIAVWSGYYKSGDAEITVGTDGSFEVVVPGALFDGYTYGVYWAGDGNGDGLCTGGDPGWSRNIGPVYGDELIEDVMDVDAIDPYACNFVGTY